MSIVVDLIVVAILGINLFIGYKRGLTGSLLKIISFFVAIVLAAILYKPVANLVVQNTTWDDSLESSIVHMLEGEVKEDGKIAKEESNLPNEMVSFINDAIEQAADQAKESIVPTVAHNITLTIISAASAVAIFIIARILLMIISILVKWVTELPLIKQVDKAGGILYGIIAGLVILWVLLAIVSFISPAIESTGLIEAISKSSICGFLYHHNLLLQILF